MNEQEYTYLKKRIFNLTHIDLDCYKEQQMRRRLEGFVSHAQTTGIVSFCKNLEEDEKALKKLRDFLTINVSEFFRDLKQFNILQTQILPELLQHNRKLSIWSAGCSHGAEPYSIAMILDELAPGASHRILATDLDDGALATARAGGPYIEADVRNIDQQLLLKYFTASGGSYRITDRIKQRVEFKQHNLLSDDFERGFDLIICRNVVIYFSNDAKRKLYQGFYDALKGNGVLFVGNTETMVDNPDLKLDRLSTSFYRKPAAAADELLKRTKPYTLGSMRKGNYVA